ncbi:NAD(P)-dependent oxidoreductase [Virgisporangium aurantiacum]|uniref:NADH-flavin reductase n=1 Tax=Virgisporangium aurantiacum TaxID=175570 RepID=A0A8J3ZEZ5_9ACTN|nr:NAD(P)-binding oxidoreductase [Virgisporangium aurantiacum]GIJ62729.1 NADH-flavin reductase [Virgisporangium aurantiacum]
MNLTIVAATGGIGRQLVAQALAAGHDVTAAVRNPANLPAGLRAVKVDLATPDPAALAEAVAGADAVLSGLGARGKADFGVAERGTRAVVAAMKETGGRRLVVVSAAPIGTVPSPDRPNPPRHDPGDGFLMRHLAAPIVKRVFRDHYTDLARMEDVIRDSGLDWTIVRPPQLTDKPLTGVYRTAYERNLRRGLKISRADVAHYMLHALAQPGTIGRIVGVST